MKVNFHKSIAFLLTFTFLFTFVGGLLPQKVGAQSADEKGECFHDPSQTQTFGEQTYADCQNLGGHFVPATFVGTPADDPVGICMTGGATRGRMSQSECFKIGGTLQPGTIVRNGKGFCIANNQSLGEMTAEECARANGFLQATETIENSPTWWDTVKCHLPQNYINCGLRNIVATMANLTLSFVSWLTALGGLVLNGAIYHTVVKVSQNYENIKAIDEGWRVIRDVANMAFIFILLYASIRTILGLGQDVNRLIVRIIVVAVLINFSLFFTSFVIDVSNLLALLFYDAMVPGAATQGLTSAGLSNAFMDNLKLQGLYHAPNGTAITFSQIILTGIMGSILMLIAAFVFFAVGIMFIIRYVVLILVLILSPIAFIAFILPQAEKYRGQWWDALSGQAFFAPIYMMLTWITLKILGGITGNNVFSGAGSIEANLAGAGIGANTAGFVPNLINFIVIIVFLIASLVIAKEWANKTPGGVGKLTGWAMGTAGGMTIGMAGKLGRNTIGRAGVAAGESETLKKALAWSNKRGGLVGLGAGMAARSTIAAARKTGDASFDLRATGIGGTLDAGKAGGKGGFADYRKKKSEAEKKFAESLGPSDKAKARAQEELDRVKKIDILSDDFENERKGALEDARTDLAELEQEIAVESDPQKKAELTERVKKLYTLTKVAEREETYKDYLVEEAKRKVDEMKGIDDKRARELLTARGEETSKENIAKIKKETNAVDVRKEAFAKATEKSIIAKFRGYNYTAAAQIRKGKDSKTQAAEALKALAKDSGVETEEEKPEAEKPAEGGGEGSGGEEKKKTE